MSRGRSVNLVIALIVMACGLIAAVGVLAVLHILVW